MHDVGWLRLLGDPRDERLGRETLGGLRRGAVNLAHHDGLTPMQVHAERWLRYHLSARLTTPC